METLEERRRRSIAEKALAERKDRWRHVMNLRVEDAGDAWERARVCGCLECPDCRPDVAAAAEITGRPFLNVLVYVQKVQADAIAALVDLKGPVMNRAQRRRQQRFDRGRSVATGRERRP